jgi:PPOX class probable F420-dependent enzyme
MSTAIPDKYLDLLDAKSFASLGTVMPDGSPQVTPVWFSWDGRHIRINSARGRAKDKNMRRDPRVSITILDPANPYRYLEVRGRIVNVTEDGADDHIDALSQKYLGKPYPWRRPGEVRVSYDIEPEKTSFMG